MMQQSHLTFWSQKAPWPKRSQIEQDLRLAQGVAAIFEDPILGEKVAMRGGTILHKGHLAPATRYSEDIDLVLIAPMDTTELERHLTKVLSPILGKPTPSFLADAWLTVRNVLKPSKILRISFKFVPVGLQREETIKVEVNLNETASLYPMVEVPIELLDEDGQLIKASAKSYDINEMLGTKTRALMQRTQGRDLYDLWYALVQSKAGLTPYAVDCAKVIEAFEWYLKNEGTSMGREEAAQLLDTKIRDKGFRSDMDTLLRPDSSPFDVDKAALFVVQELLALLKSQ